MFLMRSPVNKGIRLGQGALRQISLSLDSFKEYIPREFARKCRNLSEVDRWKATEFRQFLLYSGIVAFKGNLSPEYYDHFLLFFIAIHCLASRTLWESHTDYAQNRLRSFLEKAKRLYGRDFFVYNVHALIHISDDVRRFGPLDSYSAFCFENYLGGLKQLLHKHALPLQQVIRRLVEREGVITKKNKACLPNILPKKQHFHGPILRDVFDCQQFKEIIFNGVFFSILKGDNCVKIRHKFYLIRNILSGPAGNDRIIIIIERFLNIAPFFEYPCNSAVDFDIVKASALSGYHDRAYLDEVVHKCVMLPIPHKDREFVLLPLNV